MSSIGDRTRTHGKSHLLLYKRWLNIKARCYNKNNTAYSRYGGRGIKMCAKWRVSFLNFLNDMGEPPPGLDLERIDNDGNYTPKNCKWASRTEQANNRRSNKFVNVGGARLTIAEAAHRHGLNPQLVWQRLRINKWTIEEALEIVMHPDNRRKK